MRDQNPAVSVIVAVYNVEDYLECCLESLNAQTLMSLEVLIVDDGSTDRSSEIAKRAARENPERFIYLHKENGGLSDARNYGIRQAKGRYIGFVDGDDWVFETMFEKLLTAAEKKDAQLAECSYMEAGVSESRPVGTSVRNSVEEYLLHGSICVWNKIYLAEWLREQQIRFPKGLWHEDNSFFGRLMVSLKQPPAVVEEPLYFYRQREGSISHSKSLKRLDIHRSYEQVFRYYREKDICGKYYDATEYAYVRLVFGRMLLEFLQEPDPALRRKLVAGTWRQVEKNCPKWKQNPWARKRNVKNIYLQLLNPVTIFGMELLVRLVRFGGRK